MDQPTKELIYIMPPAYHFKRAAMLKAVAEVASKTSCPQTAREFEVLSFYELALGFEALVYESSVPPA